MADICPQTQTPVNILILGGLTHLGRALLCYLTSQSSSILGPKYVVQHVRFADKFLVSGDNTSTSYIDSQTIEALRDPRVEYRQANLCMYEAASKVFDAPNGQQYDFVFDLTGEGLMRHDVPNQILLERTTKLAGLLASVAAERKVKAYIRDTPPFWTTKPKDNVACTELDRIKHTEAETPRAYFFYEAERSAAANVDLPLVILRSSNIYGQHQFCGTLTPKIALGEVYADLQEPMKFLWSGDIRSHTLHSRDWCRAAWAAALWASQKSRTEMNTEAGVPLIHIKARAKLGIAVGEDDKFVANASSELQAPVFNLSDNDDTTQRKILTVIGEVFGVETGHTSTAINFWAKLNLASVVEESNEKHTEALTRLAARQTPPLLYTPLTCYLSVEDLAPRSVALNSRKAQDVLGWTPQEHFDVATVKEVILSFKQDGAWVRRA